MEPFDYQYLWRLFGADPFWATFIVVFITVSYACCVFGVAFGKMGRSPFWGFLFLPPIVGTIALWIFGLGRWPQENATAKTRG